MLAKQRLQACSCNCAAACRPANMGQMHCSEHNHAVDTNGSTPSAGLHSPAGASNNPSESTLQQLLVPPRLDCSMCHIQPLLLRKHGALHPQAAWLPQGPA
jgi:hypothetical protein